MSSFLVTKIILWKKLKELKKDISQHGSYSSDLFDGSDSFIHERSSEMCSKANHICRICTEEANISVFETIEDMNIASAVKLITSISIHIDDGYPKYICNNCIILLRSALEFRRKCELSDTKFRQHELTPPSARVAVPFFKHDFQSILHQMRLKRLEKQESKVQAESQNCEYKNDFSFHKPKKLIAKKLKRRVYKCRPCDTYFGNKDMLEAHRRERACVRHACPTCGILVLNVQAHTRLVHRPTSLFSCHVCGRQFNTNPSLRSHLLVHSDRLEHACPLCPYRGKQRAYLALHMRTHTGERPYLCAHCPATFTNSSNMRKHQLVHTTKQFECSKCKKTFRTVKILKEHEEAAHMNVRYQCGHCNREFWYRSKLLRHEIRVHNREKHKFNKIHHKVIASENGAKLDGGDIV